MQDKIKVLKRVKKWSYEKPEEEFEDSEYEGNKLKII